ncbi:MAG: hypothetical protein HPY61_03425 [Methanotrichaceae archaeon]|nr:hypothetical protein [Methanotrichaceae archaeon]
MAEAGETNIEIAHKLCEQKDAKPPRSSRTEFAVEIMEAVILALVAIATAWSGYQAAQWDGHQAELYAEANILNVEAASLTGAYGQELLYNTNTLAAWQNAQSQGDQELAQFYERRFLEEYKVAFDAWVQTDPFNNSQAPLGPIFMPEYRSSKMEEAANLTREASAKFKEGTEARSTADDYIRDTVFLATVLVLIAISQRFEIRSIRTGLIVLSFGLLLFGILTLFMLPRFQ